MKDTNSIDILLVRNSQSGGFSQCQTEEDSIYFPKPLTLFTLRKAVIEHGYTCELLDLDAFPSSDRDSIFEEKLRSKSYRVIGFSCMTPGWDDTLKFAQMAKNISANDIVTVVGGPHATFCDYENLGDSSSIDFIVRYEGEGALVQILDGTTDFRNLDNIPNYTTRIIDGHELYSDTFDRGLHWDDRSIIPGPVPYSKIELVLASRGCPGKCSFCVESRLFRYSRRSPHCVAQELRSLQAAGCDKVFLEDSDFCYDTNYLRNMAKEFTNRDIGFRVLVCHASVDRATTETIQLIKDMGFTGIEVGVECLHEEGLKYLKKTLDPSSYRKRAIRLLEYANKIGLFVEANYLIPLPGQNVVSIAADVRVLREHAVVTYFLLTPYPGTPLYEDTREQFSHCDFAVFDSSYVTVNDSDMTEDDIGKAIELLKWTPLERNRWQENFS